MDSRMVSGSLLLLHILLWLVLTYQAMTRLKISPAHLVWTGLLPVFGPLAGWVLISARGSMQEDAEWFTRGKDMDRNISLVPANVRDTVPLEEALLLDDTANRRRLMGNVIRTDPMAYLDVLLIARSNQDSETSHYATATIMEMQRQFQLEMQRTQRELSLNDDNHQLRREYIGFLSRYIRSGLLEGQFLRRQRFAQRLELDKLLAVRPDDLELLSMQVRNSLALGEIDKARDTARRMLEINPLLETPWLDSIRVLVDTRDREGLMALVNRMRATDIDWSVTGWQQASYWMEGMA